VYFLYPETSGVRLEDMNVLFGDATTAMPTPVTQGERDSLIGVNSPVPSLDLYRQPGQFTSDSAIPGLSIDPPTIRDHGAKVGNGDQAGDLEGRSEGLGGWISNMLGRNKDPAKRSQYRRVDQDEES
jgi:hypothetical protein